jgi:hypothetical protein
MPKRTISTTASPQSRPVYVEQLKAFLGHGDQRVLLLHGAWGTGKTHFWNRFVTAQRDCIDNKFYSYVSLFGARSIVDIKALIVLGGRLQRDSSELAARRHALKNWFVRRRQYFTELKAPYVGNIGAFIPNAHELLIEDFLICFDDLERRHRDFGLEELFGLISVLKEQNGCRVAIICNEEELAPDDRQILNRYREKVVDRHLAFAPPFEENFRIVFPDADTSIREVLAAVSLNNIRLFQQVKWCVNYFEPHLQAFAPSFIENFKQQCTRLAAAHLALSKEITMEQLTSTTWLGVSISDADDGLSETAKDIVRNLQFLPTDADGFILNYLRDGYCDTSELVKTLRRLHTNYQQGEADQLLRDIWRKVWGSYKSNAAEIVDDANHYLAKYREFIPYKYATDLLDFVKKIAPSFDADSTKKSMAEALIPNADLSTLRLIQKSAGDPAIAEQALAREREVKSRKSVSELIMSLGASDGWNPADFAELSEYSEDELFDWLSDADDPYLLTTIAEVIARGQLESGADKGGKETGKKFRTVFDRLAERSVLDKERTAHAFALVRRQMRQFGQEPLPEICPSVDDGETEA